MPRFHPNPAALGLLTAFLLAGVAAAQEAIPTPTPTGTPSAGPAPARTPAASQSAADALQIHKPRLPSSWGRVVQYRRLESDAFLERARETVHEFVLQNDAGIVRVASWHERSDGSGYWRVLVWDRP